MSGRTCTTRAWRLTRVTKTTSTYDLNGGVDFGAKTTPDLTVTLGYRFGYQHQDQYAPAINSDQHFSSGQYQRVLLGLEGRLGDGLTVRLAAGPEFRNYNASAPIDDPHTTRYYAEAAVVAALAPDQSLNLNFKRWLFVSSTGLVPYIETTCSLAYHWNAPGHLAVDLGARLLEQDYTLGNDTVGSAPSLRDDIDYGLVAGVSYAFTPRVSASLTYNHDLGRNADHNLPASLEPGYRDFEHNVTSFELRYKF